MIDQPEALSKSRRRPRAEPLPLRLASPRWRPVVRRVCEGFGVICFATVAILATFAMIFGPIWFTLLFPEVPFSRFVLSLMNGLRGVLGPDWFSFGYLILVTPLVILLHYGVRLHLHILKAAEDDPPNVEQHDREDRPLSDG